MTRRYSDRAFEVIGNAQRIADDTAASIVEPIHLLLALCRETTGRHFRFLLERGIDPKVLDSRLAHRLEERTIQQQETTTPREPLALPSLEELMPLVRKASEKADLFRHEKTDTDHLLLALIEGDVQAFQEWTNGLDDLVAVINAKVEGANAGSTVRPTSLLNQLGVDVTAKARQGRLPCIIARESVVSLLIGSLSSSRCVMPILVGENGCGKTAVVEQFSQLVALGALPPPLDYERVVSLALADLVINTRYRGQQEMRILTAHREALATKTLLFLDELDSLDQDRTRVLRDFLASVSRMSVSAIAAMTPASFNKYIESEAWCRRRVERVDVQPLTVDETLRALYANVSPLEKHFGHAIMPDALDTIVQIADRHCRSQSLPGSAFKLLDDVAASWISLEVSGAAEFRELDKSIEDLQKRKEEKVVDQDFEAAAGMRDQEDALVKVRERLMRAIEYEALEGREEPRRLSVQAVRDATTRMTGIPALWSNTGPFNDAELVGIKDRLSEVVIGQSAAINAVMHFVPSILEATSRSQWPAATYLFAGPTGTGKSLLIRQLAVELCGNEESAIVFDMNRYFDSQHMSTLVDQLRPMSSTTGIESNDLLRRPHILVFDNIDRAHRDVTDWLAVVLRRDLTVVGDEWAGDFHSRMIIATVNQTIEPQSAPDPPRDFAAFDRAEFSKHFTSGLPSNTVEHFDAVVPFFPLLVSDLKRLADAALNDLTNTLRDSDIDLVYEPEVAELLSQMSHECGGGGWAMGRKFDEVIRNPIVDQLIKKSAVQGARIVVVRVTGEPGNRSVAVTLTSKS